MIKVKTTTGFCTDLTVQVVSINGGAMKIAVITDQSDKESISVYEDEIDTLIAALLEIKGELK